MSSVDHDLAQRTLGSTEPCVRYSAALDIWSSGVRLTLLVSIKVLSANPCFTLIGA